MSSSRRRCTLRLGRPTGPIRSLYVRDPDQNLIELSNYH
jgi:catechol 2,3-dioxygenase-like lactoylglutathione lyase family enzyme